MKKYFHITVNARAGSPNLSTPELGDTLWLRLERTFPDAVSAALMPEHFHFADAFADRVAAARSTAAFLSGLSRTHGPIGQVRWQPLTPETDIEHVSTVKILGRTVRYDHLNPVRAGLVCDPLAWPYSTHRDAVGALVSPWVEPERLADVLGMDASTFRERFHRYVSSDASIAAHGTVPPLGTISTASALPLARIIAAVLAATRERPEALRRKTRARALFLALARRFGWVDGTLLRWICGVSKQTIHRHRHAPDPPGMQAAEVCLSDPRLTAYLMPGVEVFLAGAIRNMEAAGRRVHSASKWREGPSPAA